jgi:hypothetical protein
MERPASSSPEGIKGTSGFDRNAETSSSSGSVKDRDGSYPSGLLFKDCLQSKTTTQAIKQNKVIARMTMTTRVTAEKELWVASVVGEPVGEGVAVSLALLVCDELGVREIVPDWVELSVREGVLDLVELAVREGVIDWVLLQDMLLVGEAQIPKYWLHDAPLFS